MFLLCIFLGIIFTLLLTFILMEVNTRSLDPKILNAAKKKINATAKLDPSLSLIESHKILVNSIKTMYKNKNLNAAKLLNKVSKKLRDKDQLWFYHRMRNKVAHENDFKVSVADAKHARKIFLKTLEAAS